ncbi:MAG: hypothetical protein PCFJNLEI_03984 [Verrucomicrobiae bacterium]|nr:hypothetical protein [Verrucomicrobiae bacterium]
MKIKIPDELKSEVPQTFWGKILTATPIIMTVVATALAGLASSEMTRAQYSRSLAAQLQSKAGDQWGFFQAKRLRGAMQRSTLDLLQSTTEVKALDVTTLPQFIEPVTVAALESGQVPDIGPAPVLAEPVKAALEAVVSARPDGEVAQIVLAVKDEVLHDAVRAAKDRAAELDQATQPVNQALEKLETALAGQPAARGFIVARLRYTAARYDAEARLNQAVAHLYELQVRKSNLIAERHHQRSQRFFYGMLGAQAAVIISTFAIATRKRNLLWSLAAAAGTGAISFAIYVYLFV